MEVLFDDDDLEPVPEAPKREKTPAVKPAASRRKPAPPEPEWEEASLFGVELEPHFGAAKPAPAVAAEPRTPQAPQAPAAPRWEDGPARERPLVAPERRTPAPRPPVKGAAASMSTPAAKKPRRNAEGAFEETDADGRTIVRDEHTCRDPELLKELRRRSRVRKAAPAPEPDADGWVVEREVEDPFAENPFADDAEDEAPAGKKSGARQTKSLAGRAVAMLARRDYSEKELRAKLALKLEPGETAKDVDEAVAKLKEHGLLSDERFAKSRARVRAQRSGDLAIRRELRMLGLDCDVVDAAMEEIEDTEDVRCARLWRRRFGEPPADRKERERQIRYLAYRGFAMGVIMKVIRGEVEIPEEEPFSL